MIDEIQSILERLDYHEDSYDLEQHEDDECSVLIHCGRGFLYQKTSQALLENGFYVQATGRLKPSRPLTLFIGRTPQKR